jgi:hypothetical protein
MQTSKAAHKSNSVRFSSIHGLESSDDSKRRRRSAWKSEECPPSLKRRDAADIPPRRPSRELGFLNSLSGDFFFRELEDSDCDGKQQPRKQKTTSPTISPRSILKSNRFMNDSSTRSSRSIMKNDRLMDDSSTRSPRSILKSNRLTDDSSTRSSTRSCRSILKNGRLMDNSSTRSSTRSTRSVTFSETVDSSSVNKGRKKRVKTQKRKNWWKL